MGGVQGSKARFRLLAGALALVSTLLTCTAFEAALRIRRGGLLNSAPATSEIRMVGGGYPATWHPELGYAPTPGSAGRDNAWRKLVSIDSEGLRSNGGPPGGGPTILTMGDSFVFGDEVEDRATWPAALERRLDRRVLNGGVFGYGLDQIVLRAEELLDRHPVDTLLVSVIPDDVVRCEYAFRFAHKPWFDVEGGALVLHNVPAPRPEEPPPGDSTAWRLLQRSALLELVIRRLDPLGRPVRGSVRVHRRGAEVSSALVDRLAGAAQEGGHEFLLILAWHPGAEVERLAPLRRRALELGIPVGGTQPGHMTPLGNGLVADAIAAQLSRRR
jgi:hypothetical protein